LGNSGCAVENVNSGTAENAPVSVYDSICLQKRFDIPKQFYSNHCLKTLVSSHLTNIDSLGRIWAPDAAYISTGHYSRNQSRNSSVPNSGDPTKNISLQNRKGSVPFVVELKRRWNTSGAIDEKNAPMISCLNHWWVEVFLRLPIKVPAINCLGVSLYFKKNQILKRLLE
jgi:hypothetical protein